MDTGGGHVVCHLVLSMECSEKGKSPLIINTGGGQGVLAAQFGQWKQKKEKGGIKVNVFGFTNGTQTKGENPANYQHRSRWALPLTHLVNVVFWEGIGGWGYLRNRHTGNRNSNIHVHVG